MLSEHDKECRRPAALLISSQERTMLVPAVMPSAPALVFAARIQHFLSTQQRNDSS
jgi:hypothetical protein